MSELPTPAEIAALSDADRAVLACMDDIWETFYELSGEPHGLSDRALLGRLRSLRSRGLVDYRPPHDSEFPGEWAITPKGDVVNHGEEILRYYEAPISTTQGMGS